MKTFRILIEETVSQDFPVEAESREEALEKARRLYREGRFVLEPGSLEDVAFYDAEDIDAGRVS